MVNFTPVSELHMAKNAPGIDAKGVRVDPNVGTTFWRRKISFVSAGNRTTTSKLTTS
jgi:hypothetical protein